MPCTKGMTGCRRACGHRAIIEEYYAQRINEELMREEDTHGFSREMSDYRKLMTFKEYIYQRRGSREV